MVIDDPDLELVDYGTGAVTSQRYDIGGSTVELTVRNGGAGLQDMSYADDIRAETVAGAPGYRGGHRDGRADFIWDAGNAWWASLSIPSALSARADEIAAAIVPADPPN